MGVVLIVVCTRLSDEMGADTTDEEQCRLSCYILLGNDL